MSTPNKFNVCYAYAIISESIPNKQIDPLPSKKMYTDCIH